MPGPRHLALTLVAGCGTSARPRDAAVPPTPVDTLAVRTIEVTHQRDWPTPRLEVEIHFFDAISNEHLACASLVSVDRADVRYDIDDQVAPIAALRGRQLRVEVIEDDADPCPVPPGPRDDTIGLLGPITVDELLAAPHHNSGIVDLELRVEPAHE